MNNLPRQSFISSTNIYRAHTREHVLVPGTVPSGEDAAVSQPNPCFHRIYIPEHGDGGHEENRTRNKEDIGSMPDSGKSHGKR